MPLLAQTQQLGCMIACDLPSSYHILISERSGDWAGHDRVLIGWSFIRTSIDPAVVCSMKHCPAEEIKTIHRVEEHCQSRRKHIFSQDNLVHGLIHVPFTKTNVTRFQPCRVNTLYLHHIHKIMFFLATSYDPFNAFPY